MGTTRTVFDRCQSGHALCMSSLRGIQNLEPFEFCLRSDLTFREEVRYGDTGLASQHSGNLMQDQKSKPEKEEQDENTEDESPGVSLSALLHGCLGGVSSTKERGSKSQVERSRE